MSWYKIELSQKQVADGLYERIGRALQGKVVLSAADRKTLVQLAAFDTEAEKGCARTIYISPALALVSPEILSDGNAEACTAPSETSLEVLVSWDDDSAAWGVLRASKA